MKDKSAKIIKEIIIERATIKEWSQAIGMVAIVVLIVFMLLLFKSSLLPKKQVAFDLYGIYKTFFYQMSKQNLTDEQVKYLGKQFPRAVDYAVNYYAHKHNAVIFNKSAVIVGIEDVTPEIERAIAVEMTRLTAKNHR